MTYEVFYTLYSKAEGSDDRDAFAASAPEYGADDLESIWELAHMSVRDICNAAGGQTALARKFGIPLRTVQNWAGSSRTCPAYVKVMIAELLGLVKIEREGL